jgi:hypothetical protein
MISRIEPPEQDRLLQQRPSPEVVLTFLPIGHSAQGGLYRGEVVDAVKMLAADGVSAQFFHAAEEREWLELKGTTEVSFAVAIVLNLIAAAGWDAVKLAMYRWFGAQSPASKLKIDVAVERDGNIDREWYRLEGAPDDVARAFEQLLDRFKTDR